MSEEHMRGTGIGEILNRLARIEHLLVLVVRAVLTEGERIMTDIHGELATMLSDLTDKIAQVDTDLSRELADFAAQVAPKLSDDEKAQFAGIAQKLTDFTASIDTADPAPAPPAPTA